MKGKYILILLALGFCCACKKVPLPEAPMATPVFGIELAIDGQNKSFFAGENDYYLFTEKYVDDNGTSTFSGQLANLEDCPGACLESISIEFRNTTTEENFDQALVNNGTKKYFNGLAIADSVFGTEVTYLNKSFSNTAVTYEWVFGNGEVSTLEQPNPILFTGLDSLSIPPPATLTIFSSNGCTSFFTGVSALGDPILECDFFIDFPSNSPSGLLMCAFDVQNQLLEINWTFDGSTITGNCIEVPPDSVTTIVAQVNGILGCSDSLVINSQVDTISGEISICHADFIVEKTRLIGFIPDQIGFGTVNIKYTDVNGVTFESGYAKDQTGNIFEILSSSEYELNENGKQTQLFEFQFSGVLSNETDESITLENAKGTWAIAVE